jgi:hypothetical protein
LKKHIVKKFIFLSVFAIHIFCGNVVLANTLEYKVKAVLAFKIMSHIRWPTAAFVANDNIFRIGVLGSDDVLAVFKALENKELNGRKITVEQITDLDNLESFNSIFISTYSNLPEQEVLTALKRSSTLTFGETQNFAQSGGIIGFYKVQDKIRFFINKEAAEDAGLKISAQLFRVGKLVGNK